MRSKYIPFLAKLTGERRPFLNGKAKTYPKNCLLHVGVLLTVIKVFVTLFLLVGIGNNLVISKKINKLYFQLSVQIYSLLGQTEGEKRAFFEGCKKGDQIVGLPPRALGCHKR